MEHKNSYWIWLDDHTQINNLANVVVITQEKWNAYPDDIKAKFRPVSMRGIKGQGAIIGQVLFVLLV